MTVRKPHSPLSPKTMFPPYQATTTLLPRTLFSFIFAAFCNYFPFQIHFPLYILSFNPLLKELKILLFLALVNSHNSNCGTQLSVTAVLPHFTENKWITNDQGEVNHELRNANQHVLLRHCCV
jgi:hypothetical protein